MNAQAAGVPGTTATGARHFAKPAGAPRVVALDAVGTLIHPATDVAEVYYQAALRHGSRLSRGQIAERFREVFARQERDDLLAPGGAGLVTSEQRERRRWLQIVTQVIDDLPAIEPCYEELYAHFGQARAWVCFPDVAEGLARLRALGVKLVVASNFDHRLHGVLEGASALRNIACRVISSEVGYRKPATQFFHRLVAAANCRAAELMMVGDDLANDVEGAVLAGLPAVLLDRRRLAVGAQGLVRVDNLVELARRLEEARVAAANLARIEPC
jgi:putative hydrolase of the HAD superfamily